ncbi:MAG: hypothetical protein EOP90_13855 [Lysobacteraceae bacterium]|nr:MAG: hypothetical protein EOP90_13855 [Xanthomonadaceae bacterium]
MTRASARGLHALFTGSLASLASSVVIVAESQRLTRNAAAATNATSQWVWGDEAHRRPHASLRHTAVGYLIHHASSVFWAVQFESRTLGRLVRGDAARAALVASAAAVVDYGLMPRRFTPGFEHRLPLRSIAAIYAAFGVGLWIAARIHRRPAQSGTSSRSSPRAAGPLSTRPSRGSKREP